MVVTKLIGLNGKARSGKDSFASIVSESKRVKVISFAEPMRKFVCDILDIKREDLDGIKEDKNDLFGGKSPREFLQKLGTEFGRETISNSIWIDSAKVKIKNAIASKKYDYVIVTDVRFDNEAALIHSLGGLIFKVTRPLVEIDLSSHKSEQGIDEKYVDILFLNDKSLSDYKIKISEIMGNYTLVEHKCIQERKREL